MKFSHLADCHLGAWREPKLRQANLDCFCKAIDISIEENVDFVLIAGDLFNTSVPSIDVIRMAMFKLKQLKDKQIPVYGIAGSHDFSPSGKTMLDVLQTADVFINVSKDAEVIDNQLKLKLWKDVKTGALITGVFGRKGSLDKYYYDNLYRDHFNVSGFKIFMFHNTIDELKPKELQKVEGMPISFLPKGFDYYAGGHVHVVDKCNLEGYQNVIFPGPTFPNNFSELEKLKNGTFCIFENGNITHVPLNSYEAHSISINCEGKTPEEVQDLLEKQPTDRISDNTIVTLRLFGTMNGKPSQLDFSNALEKFSDAYFVMKNTNKLTSVDYEEIKISDDNIESIETNIINENVGQSKYSKDEEKLLINDLISTLCVDKNEGMKKTDFENKIINDLSSILKV
ncbi:exonuclease SbcCD subunit D [Nanoarchaeota archaeon]